MCPLRAFVLHAAMSDGQLLFRRWRSVDPRAGGAHGRGATNVQGGLARGPGVIP